MTTARRNHLTTDIIRSPFIAERRRNLFPTEEIDTDSDLGHISPIYSDGNSSDSDNDVPTKDLCNAATFLGSLTPMSTRGSETMSPLKLSPCSYGLLRDTPRKFSPSTALKTPHDTSTKPVLQEQKALLEESKSLKRKAAPSSSPKPSKVRTALFPPDNPLDISLSTKSFYSKTEENKGQKLVSHQVKPNYKPITLIITSKHKQKHTRKFGQINNGVKHKIKKPKQRKISSAAIAKATKKMLETGPALNEYLKDLTQLRNKQNAQHQLIIEPPKVNNEDPNMVAYLRELKELQKSQNKRLIINPGTPKQIQENNKENVVTESRQRSVSPLSPDDKKSRRFFKHSRDKSSVIIKEKQLIEEIPQKFALPTKKSQIKTAPLLDNSNDFQEDDSETQTNIDNILATLSNESPEKNSSAVTTLQPMEGNYCLLNQPAVTINTKITEEPATKQQSTIIILEAHNSVLASENAIQLHEPNMANTILSPISHMCDVTSGLALNSPRKGRDLSPFLNNMSRAAKMLNFNSDCPSVDMADKQKLFPIFYKDAGAAQGQQKRIKGEKREREVTPLKRAAKKFKALPPDQMLLDAGQKKFGFTLCTECNTVYHMGDPNDEIQHLNNHNSHQTLRFAGWKNEHILAEFENKGRIIRVLPTDSKIWLNKVKDVMEVVKRDLGCYEMDYNLSDCQAYLYIKNRTIAGCAVATVPIERGHRMLTSLGGVAMCSEESYPIKCGVSHIWVSANFRKQGIATALLDAIKRNFMFGTILSNNDIALTSPTEAGSAFAEKYFKTPNYLIYYT